MFFETVIFNIDLYEIVTKYLTIFTHTLLGDQGFQSYVMYCTVLYYTVLYFTVQYSLKLWTLPFLKSLYIGVLEFCDYHGIVVVLYPPHSSHILQPPDLVFFR